MKNGKAAGPSGVVAELLEGNEGKVLADWSDSIIAENTKEFTTNP